MRKGCATELNNKRNVVNDVITIKEYADQKGVSHQAVYKQLQTHAEELEPFIVKNGRTRLLTDEAVTILDTYRETNPQIVERTNDKEHVEYLEGQIKVLLARENELNQELKNVYKEKADNAYLIASAETNKLLLEDKEKQLQQEIEKNAAVIEENAILKAEIERLKHRSLLERLFNKYD